jgi:hypothetical protein
MRMWPPAQYVSMKQGDDAFSMDSRCSCIGKKAPANLNELKATEMTERATGGLASLFHSFLFRDYIVHNILVTVPKGSYRSRATQSNLRDLEILFRGSSRLSGRRVG